MSCPRRSGRLVILRGNERCLREGKGPAKIHLFLEIPLKFARVEVRKVGMNERCFQRSHVGKGKPCNQVHYREAIFFPFAGCHVSLFRVRGEKKKN